MLSSVNTKAMFVSFRFSAVHTLGHNFCCFNLKVKLFWIYVSIDIALVCLSDFNAWVYTLSLSNLIEYLEFQSSVNFELSLALAVSKSSVSIISKTIVVKIVDQSC